MGGFGAQPADMDVLGYLVLCSSTHPGALLDVQEEASNQGGHHQAVNCHCF